MLHKYFKHNRWTKYNVAQGGRFGGKLSNYEGVIQEYVQQRYSVTVPATHRLYMYLLL